METTKGYIGIIKGLYWGLGSGSKFFPSWRVEAPKKSGQAT